MAPLASHFRPTIRRRLTSLALLCAVIPVALVAVVLVATSNSGVVLEQGILDQVSQSVTDQVRLSVEAQARSIDSRLQRVGLSVLLMQAHAEEALRIPEAFAASAGAAANQPPPPQPSADKPGAGKPADKPAADNPLFYARDAHGAMHKVIDDGGPAVFYAARPDGREFTKYELKRLYTTATLDPLLQKPVASDPLFAQSFVLTEDNLLRTYPWRDLSGWPADKDLTKLSMFAWTKDKADASGLVWTSPYFSLLLDQWVVACLAGVQLGAHKSAVVGCEIPLAKATDELLGFTLGTGSSCWLQRSADAKSVTVLATQTGADQLIGVTPLATGQAPDEKHSGAKVIEAANILAKDGNELRDKMRGLDATRPSIEVLPPAENGRFITLVPLSIPQWALAGVVHNDAVTAVHRYQRFTETRLQQRLVVTLAALLVGLALAFVLSWLEARRIAHPLQVLTQQARYAVRTRSVSSVAIEDDGEIGALANTVQDLVDLVAEANHAGGTLPPAPPADEPAPTDQP